MRETREQQQQTVLGKTENDQQQEPELSRDATVRPCEMRLGFALRDCGKPATMGIPSEVSPHHPIAICEDCIRESGNPRRYLVRLDKVSP